jgi:hypothetical protein
MKIRKNGKIVNLTESDLRRIVKRTLTEGEILVDGTDLKSGYGKIKEGLLKIVDIVAQSGEGMGRIESEVRNDINSAFSSLSFDKLIKLFTELGNEQFLKSFTNAIEFEDEYKEYITDKLGTLMRDMANSVKSQKEKMASEGGEQKTEKIKENFISLSPCRSLTGEPGAECIMSLNDYEKMMGKTNKAQLKNESLKIRKNGKVINLLNEEVNKIKHLFNFKKGDVITESLLNEQDDPYGEKLKAAGYVEVDKLDLPDGDYIANGGSLFVIKDSEGKKTGYHGRLANTVIRGVSFSDGNIVISDGEIIAGDEHYGTKPYIYYKK